MSKGLTLGQFGGLALSFVVLTIILSMGGEILSAIQTDQTANGSAYNVTGKGLEGVSTFGDWLPTVAIVVASAVVIGVVVNYFQ